jgi:hypothetical protein
MNDGGNKPTFTEDELKLMGAFGEAQIAELDKLQEQMIQDLEQTMRQAVAFASTHAGSLGASYNIILKRLYEWHAFFSSKTRIHLDEGTLQTYRQKLSSIFGVIEWRIEDMKERQAALITQPQAPSVEAASEEVRSGEKKLENMTEAEFQWQLQQKLNESRARMNQKQRDAFWKSRGVEWDED